jgi:hypothetical protein
VIVHLIAASPRRRTRLRTLARSLDVDAELTEATPQALPDVAAGDLVLVDPAVARGASAVAELRERLDAPVLVARLPAVSAVLRRVAHDARGPLGVVKGALEELGAEGAPMRRLGLRGAAQLEGQARRWSALADLLRDGVDRRPRTRLRTLLVEEKLEDAGRGPAAHVTVDPRAPDEVVGAPAVWVTVLDALRAHAGRAARKDVDWALQAGRLVVSLDRDAWPDADRPLELLREAPGLWLAVVTVEELGGALADASPRRWAFALPQDEEPTDDAA